MNCPIHNIPYTLKPGGVSKTTGKAYNAFWACSGRNDDGSYCKSKPPKDFKPTSQQTFNSELQNASKSMDLDRRDEKRGEGQSWGNAKTNAVNWAIAMYQKGDMKSDQMKTWIEKCANWIHSLEPTEASALHTPITEREPVIQIEETKSDEINLDSIPF